MAEEKKKTLGALAGTSAAIKAANNSVGETKVSGEGNSMTITPKASSGSRMGGTWTSQGANAGTSTDYGTYKQDLDRLSEAQRQAQVDQLKAARTKALANLDAQEQTIKPYYQTARNQTSASSQQGARNFAEYLANRGLTNSGAAAQGEINRLSALNNNLGNLNTAEANAFRDIANQRTQVENDYVAGLANANNAITQNYYNNLLNYNEQQRQYIQGLQNQALGQYANDYQAEINNLLAQGYSPNSLEVLRLQAARGNKANNLYSTGLGNALNNVQNGYINYNNAAALGLTTPQAYEYANNYQAAQQAAAEAEAEALAYSRQQDAIKNDLNYNKYLLDKEKNDATIRNINSQIAKRNQTKSTNTKTFNDYLDELAAAGKIDFDTYANLYQ